MGAFRGAGGNLVRGALIAWCSCTRIRTSEQSVPTPKNHLLPNPPPFLNRELSTLAFAERVLAQCELIEVPLLERLRYLTIVSAILDEFFEVRVAEQQQRLETFTKRCNSATLPLRLSLQRVRNRVRNIVERQYRLLDSPLLPLLAQRGIPLLRAAALNARQRRWVKATFAREIEPVLTPIAIDPAHPFPSVANKGLHFIVELRAERGSTARGVAIVKVPRSLPRLLEMTCNKAMPQRAYILLSTLIECEMSRLFAGQKVLSSAQFRVTRGSDLWVDDQEGGDLRKSLSSQLRERPFGRAVRLEVSANCTASLCQLLCRQI